MGCKDRAPVTGGKASAMKVKSDAFAMGTRESRHDKVRMWLL